MGQCPTCGNPRVKCLPGPGIAVIVGVLLLSLILSGIVSAQGMKCSGYCTKDTLKCQLRGGKVIGLCSKNLICCDPLVSATGSCGDKRSGQKVVFFKSPNFPDFAAGDLVCDFNVRVRNDTVAIRVDFLQAEMDGLSFDGEGENMASCESDMIFVRGFNTWAPPPRCGNLTGYGVLVDTDTRQTRNLGMLSIVALMSSPKYRFHIRVAQITRYSDDSWDMKPKSVEKRSAIHPTTITPSLSLHPTKVLIRTGRPAILPRHISDSDYYPRTVKDESGTTFKIFDSQYPSDYDWRSPAIVNGEDILISTVPWQVSLRVKPGAGVSARLTDDMPSSSTTPASSSSSSSTSTESMIYSSMSTEAEDDEEMTIENYTDSPAANGNCSESEGTHFCGGSILDHRHILSASHCFFGSSKIDGMLNISSIMVVVGDTDKCTDDDDSGIFQGEGPRLKSFRYDVESVIFHYGYDHSLLMNDIAILRLNESIKYFDHVKPIKLAKTGDSFEGHEALLSGWGDRFNEEGNNNNNNYSSEEPMGPNILQSSRLLQIQNRSFCNERDLSQFAAPKSVILSHAKYMYVFDSTICTLTKNGSSVEVNTGRGDSGGSLVSYYSKNDDGTKGTKNDTFADPVLVGIVSYSIPYDEKVEMYDGVNRTVDFYTNVAFFRTWIDLVVKSFDQVGSKMKRKR